jgi:ribosomal protein L21E
MSGFTTGDRVRVDIPNTTDPDHDRYHGLHGTVVDVLEDGAGEATGDERDAVIFRVELENEETADFRWRDLRPPFE